MNVEQRHRTYAKFFVLALVLLLVCVGSCWKSLYENSRNTIAVENEDMLPLSVNQHDIRQTLRLEGELKSLLLFCSAPNGAGYENAVVEFTLQQGDHTETLCEYASAISSPYTPNFHYSSFQTGEAVLSIRGEDFPEGTDLFFFVSQSKTSGLAAGSLDGSLVPGPLAIHYSILRHDGYFVYDCVMLAALILVILGIAWLLAFRSETLTKGKGLFFASFCLLFVYISLSNPLATFLAEPHSEMVYEFWYKARELSFAHNLMSLMSGESLVWTERLLMWLAVQLAGTGKYVFVIAQLLQTCLVCGVASMFCLPTFRKVLSPEIRLLICLYLGGMMLFPSAYYFWAVSYWACFFLIPFAFVDMEKLPRWQYGLAMLFAVVLCVSRIYHILLIPMALLTLLACGKGRGKRFSLYCMTVAAASAFEVAYSMLAGGGGHVDLALLKPLQFMENAVYYQVQVLKSMFLGNADVVAPLANYVFLLLFVGILMVACWLLCFQWKNEQRRQLGCVLICLGILSFGSILINVTVCGCSATVGFPSDYAAAVNWQESFYQNGDLHFSYSYLSIVGITVVLLSLLKSKLSIELPESKRLQIGVMTVLVGIILLNPQTVYTLRIIPVDWKSTYWVAENESFYMPVNNSYMFANVSMYHNSSSIITGITEDGEDIVWVHGTQVYSSTKPYAQANPGLVSDLEQRGMLSLSVQRVNVNFADPLVLILKDAEGNELGRVSQTNTPDRYRVDFMFEVPITGVYSVEFQFENGDPAYVCDGMQIGVTL